MNLQLPVLPRKYDAALNEASAWKDRALTAERRAATAKDSITDLLAENGVLAGRVEALEEQRNATADATRGLSTALKRAAELASPAPEDPELQKAKDQIARQQLALQQYETEKQELHAELRRLAEEKNAAIRTVERMSREGAWTPEGVAQ